MQGNNHGEMIEQDRALIRELVHELRRFNDLREAELKDRVRHT